jgi:hypothetical protein
MSEEKRSFGSVLDKLEDRIEQNDRSRLLREKLENGTDKIPEGPFEKVGDGKIVGVAGYYAISTGQTAVLPIPGVRQPGYNVISHGSEVFDEYVRHTVRVEAASKHVAEFVSQYDVSAPSNIDYLTSELDVVSIEQIKERPTMSTWEVVVDVADRGSKSR